MQNNVSSSFQMGKEGNKHILYIQEAFPEDSGIFTCCAINETGKAECAAELFVEGRLKFTMPSIGDFDIKYDNIGGCSIVI
jgi:hypothetical protein